MSSLDDLETPALLVDLDALGRNIARMQALADKAGLGLRPHAKTSKAPAIVRRQLEAGAVGICCAKLSEARVMVEAGIRDILVTTPVVGSSKIRKLTDLAQRARIAVAVDHPRNVRDLDDAFADTPARLDVFLDVDVGHGRTGLAETEDLVALARQIAASGNLGLGGLQVYHGRIQHLETPDERRAAAVRVADRIRAVKDTLRGEGIEVETVTGGGTGTAIFDGEAGEITELQTGSYIYMDLQYGGLVWPEELGEGFEPALSVLSTVVSVPSKRRVVLDAGWKSLSVEGWTASPVGVPEATFEFGGDEHGILHFPEGARLPDLGARIALHPTHCDTTVNLHDVAYGVSDGAIAETIRIAARGCTQ